MKDIIKNINRLGNIHFYVFTTWPFNEMKKFCSTYELYKYKNITTGVDNAYTFEHFFNATGVPYFAIYKKDKTLSHAFLGKISIDQIKAATQN
ncbi:hypothetical protein A4D02_09330 [Niastella koreensis]|nr:hypothetical protein A4D02_09330 [Niastella koreensis]